MSDADIRQLERSKDPRLRREKHRRGIFIRPIPGDWVEISGTSFLGKKKDTWCNVPLPITGLVVGLNFKGNPIVQVFPMSTRNVVAKGRWKIVEVK